jgi:acyl carrier protein
MPDQELNTVYAVWTQVLGVEEVDTEAGFFDLGADSMMVMQAVGMLREHWPGIRVVDVFANPTVASLAAFLSTRE